jgi:hypothetical protein
MPTNDPTPSSPTPTQDAAFQQLFGVSRGQLRDQGVNEDKYVLEHIDEAMERNGPPSYRLRNRYYSWRVRTIVVFIALCLIVALVGGATGPLRHDFGGRLALIAVCVVAMAVDLGAHLRARMRYRRAMRDEVASEAAQGPDPSSRGEFYSGGATLARYRVATKIPVTVTSVAKVTIHEGVLTLSRYDDEVLAEVDVGTVKMAAPRMFWGAGVKLDLGPAGTWVVGFYQSHGLLDDARSDTRHFIQALQDAQSGWR